MKGFCRYSKIYIKGFPAKNMNNGPLLFDIYLIKDFDLRVLKCLWRSKSCIC